MVIIITEELVNKRTSTGGNIKNKLLLIQFSSFSWELFYSKHGSALYIYGLKFQ